MYVIRRLLMLIPVLVEVTFLTFAISQVTPGDPVVLMLGNYATPERTGDAPAIAGLMVNPQLLAGARGSTFRPRTCPFPSRQHRIFSQALSKTRTSSGLHRTLGKAFAVCPRPLTRTAVCVMLPLAARLLAIFAQKKWNV